MGSGAAGQWVGKFEGYSKGLVVLDLDGNGSELGGVGHIFNDDPQLPTVVGFLNGLPENLTFEQEVQVAAVDASGVIIAPDEFMAKFPGIQVPKTAHVAAALEGENLRVQWKTEIGTFGNGSLNASRSHLKSEYQSIAGVNDWGDYKKFVVDLDPDRFIFRGQNTVKRLRTSFHRTNRSDLYKYIIQDIPSLHRNLSARTRHFFNLSDGAQNGAFYNLVQHHGYPTPLLDWTYSPFVAAYFAFNRIGREGGDRLEPVRIFVFDKLNWTRNLNQIQRVAHMRPHFSILEALALGNERMVPQQALSSVTNVDDIEAYIYSREQERGQFLRVIDLPRSEYERVMRELNMMGITAASLFPGLDGACEELRYKFFGP